MNITTHKYDHPKFRLPLYSTPWQVLTSNQYNLSAVSKIELVKNAGQSFGEIQQAALHVTDKAKYITTETKQLAGESDAVVNEIMKAQENAD